MKKIFLLVSVAMAGGVLYGQSQRFVLIEGYTQASCPPCAQYNPVFHTLMLANTTKVFGLHYQVSWPGVDPMYSQNTTEIVARTSYYGVNGVPDEYMDGKSASPTQATINTEYAVASPFTMKLDYWFNGSNDSMIVNCKVTCTKAVTMATPKLQIAMIEKKITFTSAPGSNGEKVFYDVMRKMIANPSAANNAGGTTIPTTWTVGQTQSFSFKTKIPTYIYKKTEIAAVGWIQDNSNKTIHQAVFSPTPNNTTVIADISSFNHLEISPNPTEGLFTADFETISTDNYTVKVSNSLGQIVYEEKLNDFSGSYSKQIDMSTYGKGIYLVSIISSKSQNITKVIVY